MTKVSIVICTRNEERNIKKALDSIVENKIVREDTEVIIVDSYSTDATTKIASRYPVEILHESIGTRGGASNVGWANAKGEIVAYTDADCTFTPEWVPRILGFFGNSDSRVAAVGGIDLTPSTDTSYLQKASGLLDELRIFPKHGSGLVFRLRGCNVAYRKSALVECGGFDEDFRTAEETELQYKMQQKGYKLAFDPSMVVYHSRRSSFRGFWRQFYGYGYGKFSLARKYPSLLFAPEVLILPFVPLFFLASVATTLLNSVFMPVLFVALIVPLAYAAYVTTILFLRKKTTRLIPGAIAFLFVRNVASMFGFFGGLFHSIGTRFRRAPK